MRNDFPDELDKMLISNLASMYLHNKNEYINVGKILEVVKPIIQSEITKAVDSSSQLAYQDGWNARNKAALEKDVKSIERQAREQLLDELNNEFAKYTWGHYDPFSIIQSKLKELKERSNDR